MREGEGLNRHLLREREFWAEISGHIAMRTERLEIGIMNMRIAGIDQHAARSILVQHLDMITLARGLQPQFPVGVERVNQSAGIKIIAERRITQPIRYGTEKLAQRERKSVVQGKSESVRVDLGGRGIIKKKKKKKN